MLESEYQRKLIFKLKRLLPDAVIVKTDPASLQGVPDLLILHKSNWAALECKRSATSRHRPNQDYYVKKFNDMSFCSFIYPENEEEVLNGLLRSFGVKRSARLSEPK